MTSRFLVTPPTLEPLTIDEIRRHVRIDALNKEPVPDAPTVALAGLGAGSVDNGTHRYRLTFVTADGETDGGTISAAMTVVDKTINGQIALSAIPIGGSRVTARRIYRTVAAGSVYLLVATIADNSTTVYTDNAADASLGAAAPAINTTVDPELLSFQTSARQQIEEQCARSFLTQTWRYTLDGFPGSDWWRYAADASYASGRLGYGVPLYHGDGVTQDWYNLDIIKLPRPPLQSVTSITYIDASGAQQTLSTSVYSVDTDADPGRVVLSYGQAWPATRMQRNAVVITFVAGYANTGLVPTRWKQAVKLQIAYDDQHRGDASDNDELAAHRQRIDALMSAETVVAA